MIGWFLLRFLVNQSPPPWETRKRIRHPRVDDCIALTDTDLVLPLLQLWWSISSKSVTQVCLLNKMGHTESKQEGDEISLRRGELTARTHIRLSTKNNIRGPQARYSVWLPFKSHLKGAPTPTSPPRSPLPPPLEHPHAPFAWPAPRCGPGKLPAERWRRLSLEKFL